MKKVDGIKSDKSFIDKILYNKRSLIVVEIIVALAKDLTIIIVAEGVEEKEQYESLLNLKCDF